MSMCPGKIFNWAMRFATTLEDTDESPYLSVWHLRGELSVEHSQQLAEQCKKWFEDTHLKTLTSKKDVLFYEKALKIMLVPGSQGTADQAEPV
jgi:hypothetical protein